MLPLWEVLVIRFTSSELSVGAKRSMKLGVSLSTTSSNVLHARWSTLQQFCWFLASAGRAARPINILTIITNPPSKPEIREEIQASGHHRTQRSDHVYPVPLKGEVEVVREIQV